MDTINALAEYGGVFFATIAVLAWWIVQALRKSRRQVTGSSVRYNENMGVLGIIELVGSIAVPAIKTLIQSSEDAVGEGRGNEKLDVVVQATMPLIRKALEKAGLGEHVDEEMVGGLVNLVFAEMTKERPVKPKVPATVAIEDPAGGGVTIDAAVEIPDDFKKNVAYPAEFRGVFKGTIRFTKVDP